MVCIVKSKKQWWFGFCLENQNGGNVEVMIGVNHCYGTAWDIKLWRSWGASYLAGGL